MGYTGLHDVTGVTVGYMGLQKLRGGDRGVQGVTKDYKRLHGVTWGYRG